MVQLNYGTVKHMNKYLYLLNNKTLLILSFNYKDKEKYLLLILFLQLSIFINYVILMNYSEQLTISVPLIVMD